MSKYTREQVIDMATNVRDCAWPADVKEYMVLIEPMLRAYAATLSQQDAPAERMGMCFETPDDLANWLESLHTMTEDGAVTGEKWESAQIAAHAIRSMDKLGKVAHFDDVAVNFFADAMKLKLAEAREKGRGGWDGDEPGMQQRLSDMLRAHVEKGDPRDVANFCMFLHQRGESILPVQNTQGAAVGHGYFAKGSGELTLVKNPEQFTLPHVFPLYTHAERATVPEGMVLVSRKLLSCLNDPIAESLAVVPPKDAQS